jgi:Na+/H+ antiporter
MKAKKSINIWLAVLPIVTVIIMGLMSVLQWKAGMIIPILSSVAVCCAIGAYLGFSWDELQGSLVTGVTRALEAIFILLLVGAVIGSWISGGVIQALIYYSIKVINPSIFIPATCFVTAVIATATGGSFTAIATIGVALMAAGVSMGFPAPLIAGAVVSGAYFGDSFSPLSDATNVAAAMAECSLFDLVKHLCYDNLPALLISIVAYYFLGLPYVGAGTVNSEQIIQLMSWLENSYVLTPLLLLVPLIAVVVSVLKIPAVPSMVVLVVAGIFCSMGLQGNSLGTVFGHVTSGLSFNTDIPFVNALLSGGGILSMGETVILITVATSLGGVLEKIGALDILLRTIMKNVKKSSQLVLVSIVSTLLTGYATGAQMLAVILPAKMFAPEFQKMKVHTKNLARVVLACGCAGINLVPWSVPAGFAERNLGVAPSQFIPYAIFIYVIIIINIIYALTGFTIAKVGGANAKGKIHG